MTDHKELTAGAHRLPLFGALQVAVDSSQGLPSNQIHKIARDRFSRLWLAGPAGLSCFDGNAVRAYDRRNGLRCSGLRSVAIGSDDTVWVGTDHGLEALGEDEQPRSWTKWFAWPFGLCEHIDASGTSVWIGSARGLVRLDQVTGASGPRIGLHADIGFVRHVARVSETDAYAASDTHGLVKSSGSLWNGVRCPALPGGGALISRLVYGPARTLLVGTNAGLFILDSDTNELAARLIPPDARLEVTAIAKGEREWWVAFHSTLVAVPFDHPAGGATERYQLPSRINDLLVDDLGNVWIATNTSGLLLLSCLRHALQRMDIGKDGSVFSIKPGPGNTYAIGGEGFFGSISLAADESRFRLSAPAGLPVTTVWDSHEDGSGLWVASHEGVYHAASGGDFGRRFADDPVLGAPARVLLRRGEELWVGTLRGLARIRRGKPEEVRLADGKPLGYVYALTVDEESRLWVATLGRGLWREDGRADGHLEPISGGPLSATGNTYAVATGPGGDTIVLQDEKVILLDRLLSARVVEERHPVSGWTALWLDHQTVAIGSSDGLRLINPTSGTVTMVIRSLLGARDWEFTNNRTLVRDGRGGLLCGLNGGLVRVDLEQLRRFLTPPVARLTDVTWYGTAPEKVGAEYRVRPGPWTLRVRAFSAWFVDQPTVRYRFKLVGFDDAWSEPRSQPEITYSSLPPGKYALQIEAHSPLTGYGPPATLCEVRVVAPWWTLGWASLLAGATTTFDQMVRSRSRNRILSERNLLLEREVADRTSALRAVNEDLQRSYLQLEVNEEKFRLLFESAKDAIFWVNPKTGLITNCNEAAGILLEKTKAEIIGTHQTVLHPPPKAEYYTNMFRRHIEQKGEVSEEVEVITKSGNIIPVHVTASIILVRAEAIIQEIFRDITERKQAEEAMERANEELKKLAQLKTDFISTVSHELRTPMTTMKEFTSILLDEIPGKLTKDQREYVDIIKGNIDRLTRLINDLLDISKIEAGNVEFKKTLMDIADVANGVITALKPKTDEKHIELEVSFSESLPDVYADPDKIIQVFTNLIGNAIKFTPEKGKITIEIEDKEKEVECSVADTGRGIAEEDMGKLFGKFQQFGGTAGAGTKGTGLGLAITKELVQGHSGRIWAESKVGKGSKFIFTLPKIKVEEIFEEYLRNRLNEAADRKSSFSLIVVHIADLSRLQEKWGEKPLYLLTDIERLIKDSLHRKADTVIRSTGELAIPLPDTQKEDAEVVKKKIEEAIRTYLSQREEEWIKEIRITLGTATYPDEAGNHQELLDKARGGGH